MNTNTNPNRPICWCGQPATYMNPRTDASTGGPVCDLHVADGFDHLADLPYLSIEVGGFDHAVRYAGQWSVSLCGRAYVDPLLDEAGRRVVVDIDLALERMCTTCPLCSDLLVDVVRQWIDDNPTKVGKLPEGVPAPVVGSDRTHLLGGLASVDYLTRLRDMVTEVLNLAESMVTDDVLDPEDDPIESAIDMLLDDTHDDDSESPSHAMTEDEFDDLVSFLRRATRTN